MNFLSENAEAIAVIVGLAHALALAIVNLTPTPKDNTALSKAYKVVEVVAGVVTASAKEVGKK